jgi:hypothetical protein
MHCHASTCRGRASATKSLCRNRCTRRNTALVALAAVLAASFPAVDADSADELAPIERDAGKKLTKLGGRADRQTKEVLRMQTPYSGHCRLHCIAIRFDIVYNFVCVCVCVSLSLYISVDLSLSLSRSLTLSRARALFVPRTHTVPLSLSLSRSLTHSLSRALCPSYTHCPCFSLSLSLARSLARSLFSLSLSRSRSRSLSLVHTSRRHDREGNAKTSRRRPGRRPLQALKVAHRRVRQGPHRK